jgi:hypothetical protein
MRRIIYALTAGGVVALVLSALSASGGSGGGIVASGFAAVLVVVAALSYAVMTMAGIARPHRRRPLRPGRGSPPPPEEVPASGWDEVNVWYDGQGSGRDSEPAGDR